MIQFYLLLAVIFFLHFYFYKIVLLLLPSLQMQHPPPLLPIFLGYNSIGRLVVSSSERPHGLQPTRLSVHGILQQEYWSGLPCPPPGDLPNPGIETIVSDISCIGSRLFTTSATWEAQFQSGQPVPSAGNIPNLSTEPGSTAFQEDCLTSRHQGSPGYHKSNVK